MSNPVFLNYPLETFTPTQSGALATILWECCRAARRTGVEPYVITRESPVPTFDWPRLVTIPYPKVFSRGVLFGLQRAERKLTGWRHLGHKAYAMRVLRALREAGLTEGPFVLLNDPEMAITLRRRFPRARIVHWFENQLECREPFRTYYGQSGIVTLGVSNFTSRWVESYYGLRKVDTLYNGVDSAHFCPRVGAPGADEIPVINFVGRTGIEKGPDILLEAALLLCETTRRFELQVIGANHWDRLEMDAYQQKLSALVRDLERRGVCVYRPGHVGRADLPAMLRRAYIHVVPARWDEPFGMTTIEGMACGLATVAARTGGTPEVVGDAGLLFERENVDELTGKLRELVIDSPRRRELGLSGRRQAQQFSWERSWSELSGYLTDGA